MESRNQKTLVPQYMEQFQCIGSDCEDSCCIGWKVTIDEQTYKKYRKVNHLELRPLLDKKVTRNRSNPSEGNYAKIKLDNNQACPFLTEEKLCKVQLNLGEEYLSVTCSTYPRVLNTVNGVHEKSATMSCPEVVRLALLNPDKMEFDYIEDKPIRYYGGKTIDSHQFKVQNKPIKYFWEMRIFTIDILQHREYKLWERLIILGLFYQKVEEYLQEDKLEEIPQLIASYTNMCEEGLLKEKLEKIPTINTIQMELLKELADQRYFSGVTNQRYLDCFGQTLHGMQYTADKSNEEIATHYQQAYEQYYQPYMAEHEYILENYLVNYVFKNLFPFTGQKELFDNYVMMVIHYAMIKMHLIGMAGFHKESFGEDQVVKLIQSFAKTIEHNHAYLQKVYTLLQENDYTSMAYMAILIKN